MTGGRRKKIRESRNRRYLSRQSLDWTSQGLLESLRTEGLPVPFPGAIRPQAGLKLMLGAIKALWFPGTFVETLVQAQNGKVEQREVGAADRAG